MSGRWGRAFAVAGWALLLGSSSAQATITLTPRSFGKFHYWVRLVPADSVWMVPPNYFWEVNDVEGYTFTTAAKGPLDVTLLPGSDPNSNHGGALLFDIFSDKTAAPSSGIYSIRVIYSSGGTDKLVPIATVGTSNTACADGVGPGSCQRLGTAPATYFFGAQYQVGTTVRIGIYLKDLCDWADTAITGFTPFTVAECTSDGTNTIAPADGASTSLNLRFEIVQVADYLAAPTAGAVDTITQALTFYRKATTPNLDVSATCPSLVGSYFPGDGEIFFNSGGFVQSTSLFGPPMDRFILVGKLGASGSAVIDNTYRTEGVNSLTKTGTIGELAMKTTGFLNSDTTANSYDLKFMLRDKSGLVYPFTAAGCNLHPVQTASIQGFLGASKCFIATAAHGLRDPSGLKLLRALRDRVLLRSRWGSGFVANYYRWSPAVAQTIVAHPWLRLPVLAALAPLQAISWFVTRAVDLLDQLIPPARAEGESVEPFIDAVRQDLKDRGKMKPAEESGTEPHIEKLRKEVRERDAEVLEDEGTRREADDYTGRIRAADPERFSPKEGPGLTETEQNRLGALPLEQQGGAIQAVKDGKSELTTKKKGDIHHALSLRYGVTLDRVFSAVPGVQLSDFNALYGATYAPDLSMTYEYQPFHSEWFGSLGLTAQGGLSFFNGTGQFKITLNQPWAGGTTFPAASHTNFRFFVAPLVLGLNYRFNLLRILRPFIGAGGTAVAYLETRTDNLPSHQGISLGYQINGGIALLLDWISSSAEAELYGAFKVKHYYLTAEYIYTDTLWGDVNFAMNGVIAGLTFEY